MTINIPTYQGNTLPVYTLDLTDYDGAGTWIGATDSVEAVYRHFDGTLATATLSITAAGDADTAATVVVPSPCAVLNPSDPAAVPYGPGTITISRVTAGGARETLPDVLVYDVLRLSTGDGT